MDLLPSVCCRHCRRGGEDFVPPPSELNRSDLSWVVARSPFVGVWLDLLVWGLFLGVLVGAVFAGLGVELWSSGMVVEGGVWGRSNGADVCGQSVVMYREFLAAYQRWSPLFGLAWRQRAA